MRAARTLLPAFDRPIRFSALIRSLTTIGAATIVSALGNGCRRWQIGIVADSAALRRGFHLPHKARSFPDLPGQREAPMLLDETRDSACSYAPVPADRPLALYGAGNLGRLARNFLKAVGQDFILAIDRIRARSRRSSRLVRTCGCSVPTKPQRKDKSGARLAVSVVTSAYVPIERMLLDRGFTDVVPFYDLAESFRHLHPLSNGWFAAPLTADDRTETAHVLSRWMMTYRAAHHLQFLAWRRLREEWTFANGTVTRMRPVFYSGNCHRTGQRRNPARRGRPSWCRDRSACPADERQFPPHRCDRARPHQPAHVLRKI